MAKKVIDLIACQVIASLAYGDGKWERVGFDPHTVRVCRFECVPSTLATSPFGPGGAGTIALDPWRRTVGASGTQLG